MGRGGRACEGFILWKLIRLQALRKSGHFSHAWHSEHLHPFELTGLRAFVTLKAVAALRAHGPLGALVAFGALA